MTYGLSENLVFDLGSEGGLSDLLTRTSATQFSVSCYNIPKLQQVTKVDLDSAYPTYSFHVDDEMENIQVLPSEL